MEPTANYVLQKWDPVPHHKFRITVGPTNTPGNRYVANQPPFSLGEVLGGVSWDLDGQPVVGMRGENYSIDPFNYQRTGHTLGHLSVCGLPPASPALAPVSPVQPPSAVDVAAPASVPDALPYVEIQSPTGPILSSISSNKGTWEATISANTVKTIKALIQAQGSDDITAYREMTFRGPWSLFLVDPVQVSNLKFPSNLPILRDGFPISTVRFIAGLGVVGPDVTLQLSPLDETIVDRLVQAVHDASLKGNAIADYSKLSFPDWISYVSGSGSGDSKYRAAMASATAAAATAAKELDVVMSALKQSYTVQEVIDGVAEATRQQLLRACANSVAANARVQLCQYMKTDTIVCHFERKVAPLAVVMNMDVENGRVQYGTITASFYESGIYPVFPVTPYTDDAGTFQLHANKSSAHCAMVARVPGVGVPRSQLRPLNCDARVKGGISNLLYDDPYLEKHARYKQLANNYQYLKDTPDGKYALFVLPRS